MSRRFQNVSKYKHAVGRTKKDEWFLDLAISTSASDTSTLVKASTKFVAVKWGGGSSIAVLPHTPLGGKFSKSIPVINAHGNSVSDFDFSWFDETLLASGSDDSTVRLWRIPSEGLTETLSTPLSSLNGHSRRIETILFHPTCSDICSTASGTEIRLFDLNKPGSEGVDAKIVLNGHSDTVQHMAWKSDGTLVGSTCRDGKIRVWDPRTKKEVGSTKGHNGIKPSKLVWIGKTDQVFTTGFSQTREREYALWDTRNFSTPLKKSSIDTSTGVIHPLFDEDTNMMFLVGKGDTSIRWVEIQDSSPFVTMPTIYGDSTVQCGATLMPKQNLNVLDFEVAKLLVVSGDLGNGSGGIAPVAFTVARKTREFHADLYPDTKSQESPITAQEWFNGQNKDVRTVSLNPANISSPQDQTLKNGVEKMNLNSNSTSNNSNSTPSSTNVDQDASSNKPKFVPVRTSSYRYVAGKPMHPSNNFEDLRGLSFSSSGECNILEISNKFIAVPIAGSGGRLGIIDIKKPGRLPVNCPSLIAGADLSDYKFDPFDDCKVVTSSDDGRLRVWEIPESGLDTDLTEAKHVIGGTFNRINILSFHPLVKDILAGASPDPNACSLRVWDLNTRQEKFNFPHPDAILGLAWSYDGSCILSACRDKKIRLIDVRKQQVTQEWNSHDGVRGCRIVWLGEGDKFASVGFSKSSQREVNLYTTASTDPNPVASLQLDISPSVLVPYYDEDTKVMYLTGRGDRMIQLVEFTPDAPFIHSLTKFDGSSVQQGTSFIPKKELNVKAVEIARCYRLTQSNIELISFTVPRAKPQYFQDDIFIPTRDFSKPVLNSQEWLNGVNKQVGKVDLRPKDMELLSTFNATQSSQPQPTKFRPAAKIMSEEERKKNFLTNAFKLAQANEETSSESETEGDGESGNVNGGGKGEQEEKEVSDSEWFYKRIANFWQNDNVDHDSYVIQEIESWEWELEMGGNIK
ncbi:hypothetical protein BKA69DRAFT_1176292 [Paraphysoderma sedebokerense]|nr:hypothetical protein BKA69DRAFT_1176292 [Paraphysoderma sedebokerense]